MNNAQLAYNFAKKNNHSLFEQRRLKKYYDKSFEKFAKIKDKYYGINIANNLGGNSVQKATENVVEKYQENNKKK